MEIPIYRQPSLHQITFFSHMAQKVKDSKLLSVNLLGIDIALMPSFQTIIQDQLQKKGNKVTQT